MLSKLWEWLKRPHGAGLAIIYVFTAVCVTCAILFTALWTDVGFIAYIFYALAAVTLAYTVYTWVVFIPLIKQKIIALIKKHGFTNRIYEEYGFRTIIFTVLAFIISLANALINGTAGIIYLSLWYGALGAYYMLLTLMRGGILIHHRRKRRYAETETPEKIKLRELKSYTVCGVVLVLLPLALSFAILEMIVSDKAFVSSGMMIYVTAMYTCYKVVMSVINIFRARKGDDATVQAIRNVNLADALVSILALQTAMFHEFAGDEGIGYSNAITGGFVCALTAGIGIFMIVHGAIKMKKTKEENS